jgi:3-hydroxybutyrate dehydrogenase
MVGEVIDHFGRLDVLVNNAGGVGGGRSLSDDPDSFERMLFLNFTSAYYTTRAAFPQMLRQDYGRVIFIGSGYATHGGGALAYTSAKHALVGMTRALAYQVPKTVTVNTLSPGWTNTGLADVDNVARRRGVDPESVRQAMYADSVQRRILEPDEIAPMAVLLGSEEGRAITGQVIGVDGGFRI